MNESLRVLIRVRHRPETQLTLDSRRVITKKRTFEFDTVLDQDTNQETVFDHVGKDLVANSLEGYNGCLFAYGQTGSGKSWTMTGGHAEDSWGVIPRLARAVWGGAGEEATVELSYFEIYNEKVRDLLSPKGGGLRVREHSAWGPYVEGLSLLAVSSAEELHRLIGQGNKARTIASTNMNSESSRSHAVFTLVVTQILQDSHVKGKKVSRVNLVDLAGSERAVKSGAVGERLREGGNINRSLTTLGLVISKLAEKGDFVPYRDSALTWLLKDCLGGNSKTWMIGCISGRDGDIDETLSTLRYAERAKKIETRPVINEDPNAKLIRELQAEVRELRELLKINTVQHPSEQVREKLDQSESLYRQACETWEEKVARSVKTQAEGAAALVGVGVAVEGSAPGGWSLVNLNKDPSLSETLLYRLGKETKVGAGTGQDIQLSGLGIAHAHATLTITDEGILLTPLAGTTAVNGEKVSEPVKVKGGARILWGHHHLFRLQAPEGAEAVSYAEAEEELWRSDPFHAQIARLELRHAHDKELALERQRQDLQRHFKSLLNVLSPSAPLPPHPTTPAPLSDRLASLKARLRDANALTSEANELAKALSLPLTFSVVLLIPPANLVPRGNGERQATAPSVRLTHPDGRHATWSLTQLENALPDLRQAFMEKTSAPKLDEGTEHALLGIANVFLQVLFSDRTLKYAVPIVNQHGAVAGKLHVEVARVGGVMEEGGEVTLKVTLRHLEGHFAHQLIFCQYVVMENVVVVPPCEEFGMRFDHTRYFTIAVTEEFLDFCQDAALSIEVWTDSTGESNDNLLSENNNVVDRWREVTSFLKLWVEIQELNESGDYEGCKVEPSECGTGGIHVLRQGLQRRILIKIETRCGQLPILCQEIDSVSMGALCLRSLALQRPLDSYQEEDLQLLRERWGEALRRRREYLDDNLQRLAGQSEKSEAEIGREKRLVQQWLLLTEERNAVLVPALDSAIPGAPASTHPDPGMEKHTPVLFLDVQETELCCDRVVGRTAGLNALLPKEHEAAFVALPVLRKSFGDFCSGWAGASSESWALVSWDSSLHDSPLLNRPTPGGEAVFLILRLALRLSQPTTIDCVLRKRLCIQIKSNRPSLSERLKARFRKEELGGETRTGVTFQVVSHLPKASQILETREELASLAVSNESFIEEYLGAISSVDSLLALEKMRQALVLREGQRKMRKTSSVPNISQLLSVSVARSESLANLSAIPLPRPSTLLFEPPGLSTLCEEETTG